MRKLKPSKKKINIQENQILAKGFEFIINLLSIDYLYTEFYLKTTYSLRNSFILTISCLYVVIKLTYNGTKRFSDSWFRLIYSAVIPLMIFSIPLIINIDKAFIYSKVYSALIMILIIFILFGSPFLVSILAEKRYNKKMKNIN